MGSELRQKIGVLIILVLAIAGTVALSILFNDEEEMYPIAPARGTDRTTNDPMRALEERERLGVGQKLQGHVDATYSDKLNREAIQRSPSLQQP